MDEITVKNNNAEIDPRSLSELDNAFDMADQIVTKKYLANLGEMSPLLPDKKLQKLKAAECVSLFKVKKLVYDKDENSLQKLVNTYSSSLGMSNGLVMVINSDGKKTELYLGSTGGNEISEVRAGGSALSHSLMGNFPGSLDESDGELIDNKRLENLIDKCTQEGYKSISCVSGVGSLRNDDDEENKSYVQGIEKMIDAMRGKPFSAMIIAAPISRGELEDIRAEYEVLYSQLVPFQESELSFNESSADGVVKTISESLGETLTSGKSSALSVGTSQSQAHTEGEARTHVDGVNIGVKIPDTPVEIGYSHSYARTKNFADTTTFGRSRTSTDTLSNSESKNRTKGKSDSTSRTETAGRSLQLKYQNKTVQQLLDKIDEQLKRLKECENTGAFSVAAYFLAPTPMYSKMAASAYKGLISGSCTHVENANINSWQNSNTADKSGSFNVVRSYLRKLHHPVFRLDSVNVVSPASIVSGRELAVQMVLPRKSVPGVTVIETAAFGRNVGARERGRRYIELGNLYHMGRDEQSPDGKIPVRLDLDSLTMHTFITGSTGSGKSNAVYSLLERVLDENENVKFMVIEPAKGEYKNLFGGREGVKVYGTNYKMAELLRINPFSFPEDVHVLEHIDRLIEIFNVCWPMYAAMPAVLKDAVERAYINAGWDLNRSECRYSDSGGAAVYPNFADVLYQVNAVMEESKYSADSKGDYTGALCTRLKSLTNGLYGQIFTSDELSGDELYNQNVIIDLSRVGSIETKSLIMGLLVMKMQEHRMSEGGVSNSGLRHITVLEEAHNLLKRTSTDQRADSSNLLGKSVEMLANSIAEMRTYGEGFIIVDQAPGLLDMAVIRNTNTKIILRLPDMSDRELVGRAAALNDNQIVELSRLGTGVAAVYQNDWLEPVLCHVHKCGLEERPYKYTSQGKADSSAEMEKLVNYLLLPAPRKELDTNYVKELERSVYKLPILTDVKVNILKYIREREPERVQKLREKIVYGLFNSENALAMARSVSRDISYWYDFMVEKLEPCIAALGAAEQDKILSMITHECAIRGNDKESVDLLKRLDGLIKSRKV